MFAGDSKDTKTMRRSQRKSYTFSYDWYNQYDKISMLYNVLQSRNKKYVPEFLFLQYLIV